MNELWPYPGIGNRVFLDYPLDILLNRECSLKSHEEGLLLLLKAYQKAVQSLASRVTGQELAESLRGIMTDPEKTPQKKWWTYIKNWSAARDAKWEQAFDDSNDVKKFLQAIKTLASGVKVTDSGSVKGLVKQILGYHLLLSGRTIGSLRLPSDSNSESSRREPPASSGNIIIEGAAGTGKSTLALQIALAFANWPNDLSAIYFALEQPIEELCAKAYDLSPTWRDYLRPVRFLDNVEEDSSAEMIGLRLKQLLEQPDDCPMRWSGELCCPTDLPKSHIDKPRSCVLLPGLSPRSISAIKKEGHSLFWERFRQLERLLSGTQWLRNQSDSVIPKISIVCIDSLNTFGDQKLSRDELCRLFDLFRQYGVIGLCTVEAGLDPELMSSSDLVDILIRLHAEKPDGYFMRFFEIAKSRNQEQIYGLHPFKIRSADRVPEEKEQKEPVPEREEKPSTMFHAVKIFPSVHSVVSATDPVKSSRPPSEDPELFDFGIEKLKSLMHPKLMQNCVLAIVGERNTYKTALARHFLLYGLVKPKPLARQLLDSVLLIRLHEQTSMDPRGPKWLLADDLSSEIDWTKLEQRGQPVTTSKHTLLHFEYIVDPHKPGPYFYELALKGGAILPEELLQHVRDIFRNQPAGFPIRRVVLDDVAQIGASYPFLRQSQNAGSLALSAFVHVMRNYGVDLVILGTRTGLRESDEMVDRACTMADEVLTCKCTEVFGDRYITVQGGGLAIGDDARSQSSETGEVQEMAPAVIVPRPQEFRFSVEPGKLMGLVGFETGNIHRPGVILRTFEENKKIHGNYNEELRELIRTTLGTGQESERELKNASVEIIAFDPDHTQAYHDGLAMMAGKPIDRTIIATVDEFFRGKVFADLPKALFEEKRSDYLENIESRIGTDNDKLPYYASVLLLAYRADRLDESSSWLEQENDDGPKEKLPRLLQWSLLKAELDRRNESHPESPLKFAYDEEARETAACLLLDIVAETDHWKEFCEAPADNLNVDRGEMHALISLVGQSARTEDKKLPLDASVYVCWYSQLREMLERAERSQNADERELLANLRVCALPHGGFTGDWYVGVVNGSVSVSLGRNIVKTLSSHREQYKRLHRGVGLPTAKRFYREEFNAWPGSQVRLPTLGRIHRYARSRGSIRTYQEIKTVLYNLWHELLVTRNQDAAIKGLHERLRVLQSDAADLGEQN